MFAHNVSIVLATNLAKTAMGLIGSVLLVRTYGVGAIGEIALAAGLAGLPSIVSDLGFSSAYTRFLAAEAGGQARHLGAFLLFKALLLLPFLAGVALSYHFSKVDPHLFAASFLTFLFLPVSDILSNTLVAQRRFFLLSYLDLAAKATALAATIALCGPWRNLFAVAALPAVETGIKTGAFLFLLARGGLAVAMPDRLLLRRYLAFTLPLMVSQAVSASLSYIDRVFLGKLVGVHELGYYTLAQRMYQCADLVVKPLTSNLFAEIAARVGQGGDFLSVRLKDILAVLNLFAGALLLGSFFLAAPVLYLAYGSDSAPAAPILICFTMVLACKLFFRPYHHLMYATDNHTRMSYLGILNLPLAVGAYLILIPLQAGGRALGGTAIPLTEVLLWLFPTGAYVFRHMAKRGIATHAGWVLGRIYLPAIALATLGLAVGFHWIGFPLFLGAYAVTQWKLGIADAYRMSQVMAPAVALWRMLGRRKQARAQAPAAAREVADVTGSRFFP